MPKRKTKVEFGEISGLPKAEVTNSQVWMNAMARGDRPPPRRRIIWRENDLEDAGLCIGGVSMLSGHWVGKSTLVCAIAASMGEDVDNRTCGLEVQNGNVLMYAGDETSGRIAERFSWYKSSGAHVSLFDTVADQYLWITHEYAEKRGIKSAGKTPYWDRFWLAAKQVKPKLIVIDPVSSLYLGSIRFDDPVHFISALRRDAREIGAAVLLTTGDTVKGRQLARKGEQPGAFAVAGHVAWYDSPRYSLYLYETKEGSDDLVIQCVKSNYSKPGWKQHLYRLNPGGSDYLGLWKQGVMPYWGSKIARGFSPLGETP